MSTHRSLFAKDMFDSGTHFRFGLVRLFLSFTQGLVACLFHRVDCRFGRRLAVVPALMRYALSAYTARLSVRRFDLIQQLVEHLTVMYRLWHHRIALYKFALLIGVDLVFVTLVFLVVFLRFCVLRCLFGGACLVLRDHPRSQGLHRLLSGHSLHAY
jgi:hypothetical protein